MSEASHDDGDGGNGVGGGRIRAWRCFCCGELFWS